MFLSKAASLAAFFFSAPAQKGLSLPTHVDLAEAELCLK
jgi:hypothetical protein